MAGRKEFSSLTDLLKEVLVEWVDHWSLVTAKLTPLKLKRADFKNTAESQSVSIYVKLGGSDWIPDAAGNERS